MRWGGWEKSPLVNVLLGGGVQAEKGRGDPISLERGRKECWLKRRYSELHGRKKTQKEKFREGGGRRDSSMRRGEVGKSGCTRLRRRGGTIRKKKSSTGEKKEGGRSFGRNKGERTALTKKQKRTEKKRPRGERENGDVGGPGGKEDENHKRLRKRQKDKLVKPDQGSGVGNSTFNRTSGQLGLGKKNLKRGTEASECKKEKKSRSNIANKKAEQLSNWGHCSKPKV